VSYVRKAPLEKKEIHYHHEVTATPGKRVEELDSATTPGFIKGVWHPRRGVCIGKIVKD
jgi:hypothetical protein